MSDIEEIKRRLSVVEVVGEYVKLQKAGGNYRARCPFHSEKTPSFFVSPEKEIWHCFGGCQKGGDIFRFVMEIEGVEFGEALRILAQKAGVPLRGFDPGVQNQKSTVLRINDAAKVFFQKALEKTEGGKKTNEYLASRGVTEESRDRFALGYAPSSWHSLLEFLERQKFRRDDIVSAGLAVRNEEGKVYDRFRARLMFPIQTPAGQVVGFTGRTLLPDPKEAKYINTPQTIAYDKSRELYGLYQAKSSIKEKDEVIFVEGNLDVILSSQAGVGNVVATSGTALTVAHLQAISRYTKNIVFCFDADAAGQQASKRAFEMALEHDFEVQALLLMQAKDPAEVVQKQGPEAWQAISSSKLHLMEFFWQQALKVHNIETPKGKKDISNEFFRLLSFIPNNIEKGYWVKELAQRIGAREEDVIKEFQKFAIIDRGTSNLYNDHRKFLPKAEPNRDQQDKENLLAILLLYPDLGSTVKGEWSVTTLEGEIPLSKEELLLKAEIFWPSELLAKREIERIIRHLSFRRKKEEMINSSAL